MELISARFRSALFWWTKKNKIIDTKYAFHHGKIGTALEELIGGWEEMEIYQAGIASPEEYDHKDILNLDPRVCEITGAAEIFPDMGALLNVGGEKFSLTLFTPEGEYRRTKSNTSCAAGTGGFLDQQARRLGLSDSSALGKLARENKGIPPRIASRCSVFSKTDLIHAQQEGYSLEEICAGLCRGLAENLRDTLFADSGFKPPVVFSSGVALNGGVSEALEQLLGEELLIHPYARECGALGAAILASREYSKNSNSDNKDKSTHFHLKDLPPDAA